MKHNEEKETDKTILKGQIKISCPNCGAEQTIFQGFQGNTDLKKEEASSENPTSE